MPAIPELSAARLAEEIRSRALSSREVVEALLARIEALNPQINAVTVPLAEAARAAADRADRTPPTGPLHGVPFTVKESIDCEGSSTTFGVRALKANLPYRDAPAVARLKAAGAILLARTNLSELGMRLCADNPLYGRTRNPWDAALTAGGSSGGDAAAVATGMTPLGLGSDLGGSLRVPAHCCGVASLKPTTGRVAHASSLEPRDLGLASQLMLATGPLARTVEDLSLCLSVLAGRDLRDPRSVDAPLRGPAPEERRAALVLALPGAPLPASAVSALQRAGAQLEAAGWAVEEAIPPELERTGELWNKLLAADLEPTLPLMRPLLSAPLVDHLERICASANLGQSTQHRVHTERSRLMRAWSGFFAEYPVVLGPTLATEIWAPDADLDPGYGLALLKDATRFLLPGNALGLPCLVLPMGLVDGQPSSVQIYADLWREDLCLEAAAAVEAGAHRG